MSIGSSINVSIPVVGTTVETLAKARETLFTGAMTIGGTDYPMTLALRPTGNPLLNRRRLGLTFKVNPAETVAPDTSDKGSLSVSLNIDASIGSVITAAELAKQIRYALSAALASTLLENLIDGSTQ